MFNDKQKLTLIRLVSNELEAKRKEHFQCDHECMDEINNLERILEILFPPSTEMLREEDRKNTLDLYSIIAPSQETQLKFNKGNMKEAMSDYHKENERSLGRKISLQDCFYILQLLA